MRGIILAHLGGNIAHGVAHAEIPVVVTGPQTIFIPGVMFVAPVVELVVIAARYRRAGGAVLAVSMAVALVFGIAFHYVLSTPKHVTAVPARPWQGPFRLTATLLVLVDAAVVAISTWLMRTV